MRLEARLKRDWRFLRGLNRTLSRVKTIARDSDNLVCDDLQAAVDLHRARPAMTFEGRTVTYGELDAIANRYAHWAKGLNLRSILSVHALRNAMLPILTLAAIELGHLLSGTVVMETIFTLPGIGRYLIDAIFHRDYPVVQAIILLMGVLFVTLNLLVDILYGVLDPRIRYS